MTTPAITPAPLTASKRGHCVERFVRHFAGQWWALIHRHDILRACGEAPICYDSWADQSWVSRKDHILRTLKKAGLIRHSSLRRGYYRLIGRDLMPNKPDQP